MRTALTYGFEHKHLEGSLATYLFSKAVIGSPRSYDSPRQELLTGSSAPGMNSFCEAGLESRMQKVVGYPQNSHATIIHMGTSCLESWYCSLQGPSLGMTIDNLVSCGLHSMFWHYENQPIGKKFPGQS